MDSKKDIYAFFIFTGPTQDGTQFLGPTSPEKGNLSGYHICAQGTFAMLISFPAWCLLPIGEKNASKPRSNKKVLLQEQMNSICLAAAESTVLKKDSEPVSWLSFKEHPDRLRISFIREG